MFSNQDFEIIVFWGAENVQDRPWNVLNPFKSVLRIIFFLSSNFSGQLYKEVQNNRWTVSISLCLRERGKCLREKIPIEGEDTIN